MDDPHDAVCRRHRRAGPRAPPEPRSLLGYHEFAAQERRAGLRRARARARRESRRGPLGRRSRRARSSACTTPGLFEGRVPHRRPLPPYRLQRPLSRRRRARQARRRTTSRRSSPTSTCTCSAKATTTRIYYKLGAHPAELDGLRRHALRRVGAERRARQRRRAVQPLGRPQARDADARRLRHLGAVRARTSGRARSTSTRSARTGGRTLAQGRPVRLRDGAAARATARSSRRSTATSGRTQAWMDVARPRRITRRSRSTSTKCIPASGGATTSATPPFLNWRELADELIPYVEGPGLHAPRADGRGRASVRRLVGLPGRRLLRADVALRHRRRTSCTSSIAATRPASA